METLRENRLWLVFVALAVLMLVYSNPNRSLSITTPQTVTVDSGTPILFVNPKHVTITYQKIYAAAREETFTATNVYDNKVLFTRSFSIPFGYEAYLKTYSLNSEELSLIDGKKSLFSMTGLKTIEYEKQMGFIFDKEPYYVINREATFSVQTLPIKGLMIQVNFNNKEYTGFADVNGMASIKVMMPSIPGDYIITVYSTDPWSGQRVSKEFMITVKDAVVVDWQKERIAYTGEDFTIRFDVTDAYGNKLQPSFLPTLIATLNGNSLTSSVDYVSSGVYEVTVSPVVAGVLKITATANAYGYEPSTETVSVDVVKSVAKISHNIKIEELLGAKTYTISVSDPRGTPIDAVVTVTVDEPLGARVVLMSSKVAAGKYAVAYRVEQTGVYYWTIDVVPATAIEPVTEQLIMNAVTSKNPVTEIGGGILKSPVFSFGAIGLAVTVLLAVWRYRRMQAE